MFCTEPLFRIVFLVDSVERERIPVKKTILACICAAALTVVPATASATPATIAADTPACIALAAGPHCSAAWPSPALQPIMRGAGACIARVHNCPGHCPAFGNTDAAPNDEAATGQTVPPASSNGATASGNPGWGFVDENSNGICDHYEEGTCPNPDGPCPNGTPGSGANGTGSQGSGGYHHGNNGSGNGHGSGHGRNH